LFQGQNFFRGQRGFLLRLVELRPVCVQLIATVLRHENLAVRVNRKPFAIADPSRVAIGRREFLIGLVCIVAPDAAARFEFLARIFAGRLCRAILCLARVRRAGNIDKQRTVASNDEGMHRVIAAKRQAGHDGYLRAFRHDRVRGHRVLHDAIVDFGVERAIVKSDAGAAFSSGPLGLAESLVHIGFTGATLVLERDQETALMRLVVAKITARPCVHIHDVVGRDDQMPRVTDAFGEDRRAKPSRKLQSGIIRGTSLPALRGCWYCIVARGRSFRSIFRRRHYDSSHDH
jgi:hypothetical protein